MELVIYPVLFFSLSGDPAVGIQIVDAPKTNPVPMEEKVQDAIDEYLQREQMQSSSMWSGR